MGGPFYLPVLSYSGEERTLAIPPRARTRLLCLANCGDAVKCTHLIFRLYDFTKSIHIFLVDFSALVLSAVSFG